MKKRNKFISTLAAAAMVAVMAGATLPTTALAEGRSGASDGSMIVSKTATLEEDGTYTIQLEAFSTGETLTVMKQTPTDIVLVLDVSGSMADDFTYTSGKAWTSVKDRVTSQPSDAHHHCPDGTYSPVTWSDTWSIKGHTYRYTCNNCKATRKWENPLSKKIPGEGDEDSWNLWRYTDITKTENKMLALQNAVKSFIDGVAAKNAGIADPNEQHRVAIVKFASETTKNAIGNETYKDDGYTYNYTQAVAGLTTVTADTAADLDNKVDALKPGGATAADKGMEMAQGILANSSGRDTVVILFTDGEPTYNSNFEDNVANSAITTSKALKDSETVVYSVGLFDGANPADTSKQSNAYLNGVSSNYPEATAYNSLGNGKNDGYYKTCDQTGNLTDIFNEIESSIGTTTVTLNTNAELRDVLNGGFVLTENSDVTVQVDTYKGRDRYGNRVFNGTPTTLGTANCDVDKTKNVVTVSGFDYSQEYLIDGDAPDSNDFTAAKQGKKIIVKITGVEATDPAVTNSQISTNSVASGIYDNSSATIPYVVFPQPMTQLSSKVYVMDYAKRVSLTDLPNSLTHMDLDGMHKFITAVTSLDMTYGKADGTSYTPTTTLWNGYDDYYVFGKWNETPKGVTTGDNTWTKISVLPANNVYYEDDFVTTSTDGGQTGTVGIVYSEKGWETDGTSGGNTANTDNSHGEWVEDDSRANDGTYSDGTAHKGSAGATASFTFTGTGVDIYSRTDMTTGTVVAQLKGENGDGQPVNKLYIVDNYSNDHDENGNAVPYYQIPTVTFGNLDYGTYTVTITVTTAAAGRSTYYLDGIRVYNPLGNSLDETVKEAYGPTELNATFTEVRSLLSGNGDWSEGTTIEGAVYIDQIEEQSTPDFAVYEKDGPKDEVYLSNGQAIAFAVDDPNATYYIGLKGPQGKTSAEISNGDNNSKPQITSASDLYYQVMPYRHTDAEGNATYFIMVKNTGDNLLSVTKLRVTGSDPAVSEAPAPTSFSLSAMRSYINTFDTLETVAYTAAPEDAEGSEEAPEVTEPDNTEGETSEIVPPEDVVIENPEPAEPEQPAVSPIRKILNKIFNGFRGLFQR